MDAALVVKKIMVEDDADATSGSTPSSSIKGPCQTHAAAVWNKCGLVEWHPLCEVWASTHDMCLRLLTTSIISYDGQWVARIATAVAGTPWGYPMGCVNDPYS